MVNGTGSASNPEDGGSTEASGRKVLKVNL